MATRRSPTTYQLHVELGGLTLMEFVDKVAGQVLAPLPDEVRARYRQPVRQAVEAVLREHIVGYDTCGMSSLCGDSEPFDPWPQEDSSRENGA